MSLSLQFLSLLAMIGTGIIAGAIMDMIGTGIDYAGKKSFLRRYAGWFETVVWIIIGCASFYVLFVVRDGAWRMYDPFAQLSGMLLYAAVFYRPFRLIGRIVVVICIKPIVAIIRFILLTIRKIIQILVRIVLFLLAPLRRLVRPVWIKFFKKKTK